MPISTTTAHREAEPGQQPLDRALAVLEFVLSQRAPVAASAVAQATGLPAATTHRLIGQLEARSLLKRALGSKKLLPGGRLVGLGAQILNSALVVDHVHLLLARLAAHLEENCHLGIISGVEVLYVASARSTRPSGLIFEPGRRAPIHCSSIGKMFLSTLSDADLDQVLRGLVFEPYTPKTILSAQNLVDDLKRVRRRCWASTDEEYAPGVVGCAVPVRNSAGLFLAGLGVSVPAAHCRYEEVEKFIPDLLDCAAAIQRNLIGP